mmetsp:Transcript_10357/g.29912  ORF Transcript_10357/g.29912 Transcript_10357/m.29912 type:complete len:95 (+) Transcript_10357:662-946(+)
MCQHHRIATHRQAGRQADGDGWTISKMVRGGSQATRLPSPYTYIHTYIDVYTCVYLHMWMDKFVYQAASDQVGGTCNTPSASDVVHVKSVTLYH